MEAEIREALALAENLSAKSSDSGLSEETCWELFGGPCPEALKRRKKSPENSVKRSETSEKDQVNLQSATSEIEKPVEYQDIDTENEKSEYSSKKDMSQNKLSEDDDAEAQKDEELDDSRQEDLNSGKSAQSNESKNGLNSHTSSDDANTIENTSEQNLNTGEPSDLPEKVETDPKSEEALRLEDLEEESKAFRGSEQDDKTQFNKEPSNMQDDVNTDIGIVKSVTSNPKEEPEPEIPEATEREVERPSEHKINPNRKDTQTQAVRTNSNEMTNEPEIPEATEREVERPSEHKINPNRKDTQTQAGTTNSEMTNEPHYSAKSRESLIKTNRVSPTKESSEVLIKVRHSKTSPILRSTEIINSPSKKTSPVPERIKTDQVSNSTETSTDESVTCYCCCGDHLKTRNTKEVSSDIKPKTHNKRLQTCFKREAPQHHHQCICQHRHCPLHHIKAIYSEEDVISQSTSSSSCQAETPPLLHRLKKEFEQRDTVKDVVERFEGTNIPLRRFCVSSPPICDCCNKPKPNRRRPNCNNNWKAY